MTQPENPGERPERSTADDATNPLLDFSGFPRFDRFSPEQVTPAVEALIAAAQAALARVTDPATALQWDDFIEPLEDAVEHLSRVWGIVAHLNAVADTPELRQAFNENLPAITAFWTALAQNTALFEKYRQFGASAAGAALTPARRRIVDNALRNFRLGGAELASPARERFAAIQQRHAALGQKFSENVLDATNAFARIVRDPAQLDGLPEDAREAAREAAGRDGIDGWKFTLHFPSWFPVMQYANDRTLREEMYRAYVTRASSEAVAPAGDAAQALDNAPVIDELLALRDEEARLLGYASFAEVSLATKMAESPAQVKHFLRELAARARPFAQHDLDSLREFAAQTLSLPDLQAWDLAWASEKLKEARFDFSDREVRQYFPLPRVLDGLFRLAERFFDVTISPDEAPAWHPDVRFFRIERATETIGHFHLDLYARESKRPGAWMDDARPRHRRATGLQTPIARLTCNFQPPVGDRPALLTHDDVTTLFHEFGHGLHHLLTRIDDPGVAGIAGVEWDAVELPSQFMENFCWDWSTIQSISAHVDTGVPLPRTLFDRMLAAKNFQSGMATLRQIEFALFDMRLHSENEANAGKSVQDVLDEVRREIAVVFPPSWNRFQNSFSHVFAGGYSAGYYSYKWAEVLSADAWSAFEDAMAGSDAAAELERTGRRFLDEILSVGGSRPAIDSFRAFRGRDPEIDALLRHNGMITEALDEPSDDHSTARV